jgi:SAM-dependent methyltransferase
MSSTFDTKSNVDLFTVHGFGREWKTFDQKDVQLSEMETLHDLYFSIFPWDSIDRETAVGADFGCGSGRWARLVAPRVKHLHLVDASAEAIGVAKNNLSAVENVSFHCASIEKSDLAKESLDFGFSLGVLHHIPEPLEALKHIATSLRPGAPFLAYLYYKFDDRPAWYRAIWKLSDLLRYGISRTPFPIRYVLSQLFAFGVYWPLARIARLLDILGILPKSFPLAFYRERSLYVMRNDALDRLGTRLEHRYSKSEISDLFRVAGFERLLFSESAPFWCVVGYKGAN